MEVELPDGTIAEFPDTMTPEQIQGVLAKQFGSPAPQDAPTAPEEAHWGHKAGALIDGAAQGLTFGFSDEIAAGLNSGFGLFGSYDKSLAAERKRMDENKRLAGGYRLSGEIPGVVASAVGTGGGALLAKAASKGMLPAMAVSGVEGAAVGALAGAGYSDTNKLQGAYDGAKVGAITGAAAQPIMKAAGAVFRPVANKVAAQFGTPSTRAYNRVYQALDGKAEEARKKLSILGDDGMLVDVLGDKGRRLARSTSNVSPDAGDMLNAAVSARAAQQPDRIVKSLLDASGLDEPKTVDAVVDAIRAKNAPAINSAYLKAKDAGFDLPNEPFRGLMQSPMVRKAVQEAHDGISDRAISEGNTAASKLAVFDAAKKRLDAKSTVAARKGDNDKAGIAGALAKKLRETVDSNIPEYAGARKLAQKSFQAQDAVKLGVEGARPRIPVDYAARVAQASDNQPQVAQGYAAERIQQILNTRSTPGVADRYFGNPQQVTAMNAALGRSAPKVAKQVEAERVFGSTERALKGNSTTAQQLFDAGTFAGGAGAGLFFAGDPTTMGASGLAAMLARRGGAKAVSAMTKTREEAVAPLVAKLLMSKNLPASPKGLQIANSHPETRRALAKITALLQAPITVE